MAFERWQFAAATLARQKYLAAGAISRMLHRQLSKAFEQWQWVAAEIRRLKHELAEEAARMRRMLSGAIIRMQQRKLSMIFEKWQYEAANMKHQRKVLEHALDHLLHQQLCAAYNQWKCNAELLKAQAMTHKMACNSKESLTNILDNLLQRRQMEQLSRCS